MKTGRAVCIVIVLLALCCLASASKRAIAQTPDTNGYLGKSRSEYSIFVFGDSLAAGLWAGSRRIAKQNPRLKIKGRFKEGSGLARPRLHDWAKTLPKIIERNPMDIAVVLIGSNDSRPVRQVEKILEFGTDEWSKYYARRVDRIIRVLKSNKIAVYWLEIPPMGSAKHDTAVKQIAQIHRDRVAQAGLRYVEIRKAFTNEDGTYSRKGFDIEGQYRRLRSRDDIHFLKSGNTKLAKLAVDAITRDIEVSDGLRDPDPVVSVLQGEGDQQDKPLFGHSLSSGEAFILKSSELPRAGAIAIARATANRPARAGDGKEVLTSESIMKKLRATAVPGSAAGRLFRDGEWPEAPVGRLDDFSWPNE